MAGANDTGKSAKIYDSIQEQKVEAAGTSREFSDEKRLRKKKLEESYMEGIRFPEKEVLVLTKSQEPEPDRVSYQIANSFWFLPERKLTDEVLLEIIDYGYKMDYSLSSVNRANGLVEADTIIYPAITEEQALQSAQKELKLTVVF